MQFFSQKVQREYMYRPIAHSVIGRQHYNIGP